MAKWSDEMHLLEHQHSTAFPLVEVEAPNLMRGIFPYTEIPRIDFDNKVVLPRPPKEMFITDTTFRDGQQARPPYAPEEIAVIFDMLHKLGGPSGIIRQTEFFLYSERDLKALELCREFDYKYPEITGWIRANPNDLKLVAKAGLHETGMLTSVSDYHIFLKLKMNRRQAMDSYLGMVKAAYSEGIVPRCHFEDITRADIHGFCIPLAVEMMKLSEEAKLPLKIRLCDTMGYGVPYTGAALPRSVQKLVRAFIDDAGVPGEHLEWHGHNDFHKVLVNAVTAWLYGCAGANATVLGYGERTGNAPVEGLVVEYIALRGSNNGIDTTVITELRNYFERSLGARIPDNYPLVGKHFNVTRAGIHVDGLIKNEEIYNIFDTQRILRRPLGVVISDKSGQAGIAHWINSTLALTGERRIDKRHPGVVKFYQWVMKQYDQGRTTSISDEELQARAAKYLPELFVSELDRVKTRVKRHATELIEELISHEAFHVMNVKDMEKELRGFLEENPSVQWAYVADLEGKKVTRNITQREDKAQFEIYEEGVDFSDRQWFKCPLKDGKIYVTDYFTSKITGRLCITASAPVQNREGSIVGILGLDFRFEDMAKLD